MNVKSQAAVTRYGSYTELPGPMLDDTLLRLEADPATLYGAWEADGGYAFASIDAYSGARCWLNVVGSLETAPVLVEVALGELGEKCDGLTVPRGLDTRQWFGEVEPGRWDAMRCDAPPPARPGEERVAEVTDLATLQAFLDRVNPHHSVRADHPEVENWLGVADEASGELLAVGAFTRRPRGTAYLASIATAPEARGQGLGAAVTAALTRQAFTSGDSLCALAHYHPNEAARRIYLRLGYRTTHQSDSSSLIR
jgi:ribosomal protein S18 acetylase RimI-like enzyme